MVADRDTTGLDRDDFVKKVKSYSPFGSGDFLDLDNDSVEHVGRIYDCLKSKGVTIDENYVFCMAESARMGICKEKRRKDSSTLAKEAENEAAVLGG